MLSDSGLTYEFRRMNIPVEKERGTKRNWEEVTTALGDPTLYGDYRPTPFAMNHQRISQILEWREKERK